MIAMQYSFTLPADYDMAVIDRRIQEKGPLLDGFPHLVFKAYLAARRQGGAVPSTENLYAPFYLWDSPEGINAFLTSPGFAGLVRDFGWPIVRTWVVWQAERGSDLATACFASRQLEAIPPHTDLAALRTHAAEAARGAMADGACAAVAAFSPTDWTLVHVRLWRTPPSLMAGATQLYTVGHVSLP